MLFEEETQSSRDLFDRLKKRVAEIGEAVKHLKQENTELKHDLALAKDELAKTKIRLEFYEGERKELQTVVEDLLKDFEKVSG